MSGFRFISVLVFCFLGCEVKWVIPDHGDRDLFVYGLITKDSAVVKVDRVTDWDGRASGLVDALDYVVRLVDADTDSFCVLEPREGGLFACGSCCGLLIQGRSYYVDVTTPGGDTIYSEPVLLEDGVFVDAVWFDDDNYASSSVPSFLMEYRCGGGRRKMVVNYSSLGDRRDNYSVWDFGALPVFRFSEDLVCSEASPQVARVVFHGGVSRDDPLMSYDHLDMYIYVFSDELDAFFHSFELNEDLFDGAEFLEPVVTYSNVHGALGCIGSYAVTTVRIK